MALLDPRGRSPSCGSTMSEPPSAPKRLHRRRGRVKLDTIPHNAFGFQLRNDTTVPRRRHARPSARRFNHNWTVTLDYNLDTGKNNGIVIRTALTR